MKINKVIVTELFGVFEHEILLNNAIGITIIIGENGLGKTILFEMIEAFFNGNYGYFNDVEFKKMSFDFDDGTKWVIQKEINEEGVILLSLIQIHKNKSKSKPYKLMPYTSEQLYTAACKIARRNPNLMKIGPRRWRDIRTGERLLDEDVVANFSQFEQASLFSNENDEITPKWFTEKCDSINVSLIETQRLISTQKLRREDKQHARTVEKYSNELSQSIKSYLTESTKLTSELDRTYPNRLIKRLKKSSNLTKEDLNKELKDLETKRKTLDAVGLIEIEKDSNILEIEDPEKNIIDVLKLYVEDSFEKLKIFETISSKIGILLDIINIRFKHKKLYIDKDEGFLFKSTIIKDEEGQFQRIPVTKLSSGEQNELVLFYLLLFKTEPNSLILIDEPEVSLHISWQKSFIKDLIKISKINNLDVLIATHSPDIISENWDLKVELKGLE